MDLYSRHRIPNNQTRKDSTSNPISCSKVSRIRTWYLYHSFVQLYTARVHLGNASNMMSALSSDDGVIHSILSYDTNIMLAAVVSLLLVILFVLLLHIYAKWFLAQARQRGETSMSIPQILGAGFYHFQTVTVDSNYSVSPSKGLEASTISSIPLFTFKSEEHTQEVECVICLSLFENEETGRRLPKCDHEFHVECIDMWLHSHTTCPICRAPVVSDGVNSAESSSSQNEEEIVNQVFSETTGAELRISNADSVLEIVVENPNSETDNAEINDSSSSIGRSLKRMFSRNRSERKLDLPSSESNT